jgi:hypothetical protein
MSNRFKRRDNPTPREDRGDKDVVFIRNTRPETPPPVVRLAPVEDRRMNAARMAVCFGIREWMLEFFKRHELEKIVREKEYAGIRFDYPANPSQGVRGQRG